MAEYFWIRGFEFAHETVRDWKERFLPHFAEQIRTNLHENPPNKVATDGLAS
ncbi:hypothetical protein AM1_5430 [Acaryochloris marina MBIC11017]|uniref:Transposase n=1 Tax=Acaryochloris marina (strain MBIC 11017) TaxID=329726 RepID=B0CCU4_ACAM1|nr:hypothetical protein [Acaryochloris marina]ABW30386.1 hypothetical protein AM1_5430 [Acaryochloris marina MBIC11017]